MSSIGTGYDQSTTTFSPDGRVFQVEYASKAVDNSSTAVGIRCKDGVALAVEKPMLSKMLVEGSNRRILTVDKHSGICVSGLMADARQIVNHARDEAANYLDFNGGPIPGSVLCDRVSGLMHTYTLYWYVRPFGASVLIANYAEDEPQLYAVEPSGISYRFLATAVGKGKNASKSALEKLDLSTLTCRDAVIELAKILYTQHDPAKDKPIELELSWVCDASNRMHQLVPPDLKAEAWAAAKAAREAMDED
jgi:20S proteasome subunit alpha 7|eukprot:CAMPEP_0181211894 /NCGR_PEP_ID=MMETSP1096-20121128/24043_1 /TAXON_ID=156174 ORGANISM="Chrysochromulina ericina, Strain CCMP281" /NCGR_SAMPLE_ID=MMETSP1096 /ASSEMBLY_ACC=CAM_ASM_000453 /LENGTH=249 /DNA_ID=CAMNT_0023303353 /DNA_START=1 /DNA_END=750 /DNA_ORIENTATION=+